MTGESGLHPRYGVTITLVDTCPVASASASTKDLRWTAQLISYDEDGEAHVLDSGPDDLKTYGAACEWGRQALKEIIEEAARRAVAEQPKRPSRKRASKPKIGTKGRRKIDDVHDGLAEYAAADLFTEVHGVVVSILYDGTEEARERTDPYGQTSFGIVVKMKATRSDPQQDYADYVTVRFYSLEPETVMLFIFDAARRRAPELADQLFAMSELNAYEGDPPGTIIHFNRRTWQAHSELFQEMLSEIKAAWDAEQAR